MNQNNIIVQKMKEDLIQQKREKLFKSFALSSQLIYVMDLILHSGIKETNFRNPKMFNKIDKIGNLLQDVQKSEFSKVCKVRDDMEDTMEVDHSYEIYRLLWNMGFRDTEQLKEFNDGVELQLKKEMEVNNEV